jgi:hypothetical protein
MKVGVSPVSSIEHGSAGRKDSSERSEANKLPGAGAASVSGMGVFEVWQGNETTPQK